MGYLYLFTGRIELIFGVWLSSVYPTLCYKEISVSPKIMLLSFGTLSQTSGFRKFRYGKSIALLTIAVVVVDD